MIEIGDSTIVSSPRKFDLVASYKGSFAYTINTYLRTIAAKQQLSEELKSEASECIALDKLLQSLMHMQGYPTRGIVYRCIFNDYAMTLLDLAVGDVFANPGYTSTAVDPRHSLGFAAADEITPSVMLVITVPRDTPHFYIDGLRDVYCKRAKNRSKRWAFQSEVMLNKGQRMKITKIDRCRKIEKGWSASSDCESPTLGYPANVCVIHACLIK